MIIVPSRSGELGDKLAMNHIAVCICTYKRPELLLRLLQRIVLQSTKGLFSFSVLVVDNDHEKSAEDTVVSFKSKSQIDITYHVEPQQNIARARNKAVENAYGEFIAFIDDDEVPCENWLVRLYETGKQCDVAGVLGPVERYFDVPPPKWVLKSNFYVRPTHETGFVMNWHECRTGNLLLSRRVFSKQEQPFRPEFRAGEDQDFFRRKIEEGHRFIWCSDAPVYELVPPIRWNTAFMLRRALLRGATAVLHPSFGLGETVNSIAAVGLYSVILPFALCLGYGQFMRFLVPLFDHIGKLLALVGLNPVKEEYVTENAASRPGALLTPAIKNQTKHAFAQANRKV